MEQYRRGRNSEKLIILIVIAIVYSALLRCECVSTGVYTLDGAIGVMLGLYVCSHPAANAVDGLLFRRDAPRLISSKQADAAWLGLNVLTLLTGWLAIFMGATRFTQP
jgi:hypothetical protein